jgi:hypothetical protein
MPGNTTPTAANPLLMPNMVPKVPNASVCPVKNGPIRPARIDIYFCK